MNIYPVASFNYANFSVNKNNINKNFETKETAQNPELVDNSVSFSGFKGSTIKAGIISLFLLGGVQGEKALAQSSQAVTQEANKTVAYVSKSINSFAKPYKICVEKREDNYNWGMKLIGNGETSLLTAYDPEKGVFILKNGKEVKTNRNLAVAVQLVAQSYGVIIPLKGINPTTGKIFNNSEALLDKLPGSGQAIYKEISIDLAKKVDPDIVDYGTVNGILFRAERVAH